MPKLAANSVIQAKSDGESTLLSEVGGIPKNQSVRSVPLRRHHGITGFDV